MSKIEWTDKTWNPVTGCNKVSPGCRNCYAESIAKRFWGNRKFSDVQFHEDRLLQPFRWKKPQKVFVNSMSDLFHDKVTDEQLDQVFAVMALCPQHTFQVLTKRPQRMMEYLSNTTGEENVLARVLCQAREIRSQFPKASTASDLGWPYPNVWLGVSVENQKAADERIPLLLQTPAATRFLSCEPLLESVNLTPWLPCLTIGGVEMEPWPIWVIVGGESGSGARPCDTRWIQGIVEQCQSVDVPVFVKQTGSSPVHDGKPLNRDRRDPKGASLSLLPESYRVQQFSGVNQ